MQAADLPAYLESTNSYNPAAMTTPYQSSDQSSGVDWNGYFFGASGSIESVDPFSLGADAFVGVTATAGGFLYGGVLSAGLRSADGGSVQIELASRLGLLLNDDIAAFALFGGGYETGYDDSYGIIGGGLSVAVAENLSIDATIEANRLNGSPGGGEWRLVSGLGFAFHF